MILLERLRRLPWALPLARVAFFATSLAVFIAAVIPEQDHPPDLFGWDKANHFFAFWVLSVMAAAAFPRVSLLALGAALSAFGGFIELVQAIPFVHRDADVMDWLTDTAAVLATLGPLAVMPWRDGFQRPRS